MSFLRYFFVSISTAIIIFSVGQGAFAQTSKPKDMKNIKLPNNVERSMGTNPDLFIVSTVQQLLKMNSSGVVTKEDVARYNRFVEARNRANALRNLLPLDIDGDGIITLEEKKEGTKYGEIKSRATYEILFEQADTNKDQQISYQELAAHALKSRRTYRNPRNSLQEYIFEFDLNNDEKVEITELITGITEVAKLQSKYQSARRGNFNYNNRAPCALPAISGDVEIVLLNAAQGLNTSSVVLNPSRGKTTVASLTIEPGGKPLYIFAVNLSHLIWHIEGDTKRVQKFVAQPASKRTSVGITGLKTDQVDIIPAKSCLNYTARAGDAKTRIEKGKLANKLGQNVDHLVIASVLDKRILPSGKKVAAGIYDDPAVQAKPNNQFHIKNGKLVLRQGQKQPKTNKRARKAKGKEIQIDPESIISSSEISVTADIPQEQRIDFLVRKGFITRSRDGYYVIEKNIDAYPADVQANRNIKYLIAKGVAIPNGDAGTASVYLEETGECLHGPLCRR